MSLPFLLKLGVPVFPHQWWPSCCAVDLRTRLRAG